MKNYGVAKVKVEVLNVLPYVQKAFKILTFDITAKSLNSSNADENFFTPYAEYLSNDKFSVCFPEKRKLNIDNYLNKGQVAIPGVTPATPAATPLTVSASGFNPQSTNVVSNSNVSSLANNVASVATENNVSSENVKSLVTTSVSAYNNSISSGKSNSYASGAAFSSIKGSTTFKVADAIANFVTELGKSRIPSVINSSSGSPQSSDTNSSGSSGSSGSTFSEGTIRSAFNAYNDAFSRAIASGKTGQEAIDAAKSAASTFIPNFDPSANY